MVSRIISLFSGCKMIDTTDMLIPRLRSLKAAEEYVNLLGGTPEGEAVKKLISELSESNVSSSPIAVSAENDILDKNTSDKIFGGDLVLTQSKTEAFVNCKFAYACKYHLSLDDGQKAEFSYSNIGTFIHHILEKFLFAVYVENGGFGARFGVPIGALIMEKYLKGELSEESEAKAKQIQETVIDYGTEER